MLRIAKRARELTGASAAHVAMLDGSELVTGASVGDEDLRLARRFPARGALTLDAIASGESVLCRDTETDERADADLARRRGSSSRSRCTSSTRRCASARRGSTTACGCRSQ
jgi:hypothetical protein